MWIFPWGKAGKGNTHHLAHHCADVAACFEALARLPVVRRRLAIAGGQDLDEVHIHRLSLLTFLHDIGKVHPQFQEKIFRAPQSGGRGHSAEGLALVFGQLKSREWNARLCDALHLKTIGTWGDAACMCDLMAAVFVHHGRPVRTSNQTINAWRTIPTALGDYDVARAVEEIGACISTWFDDALCDHARSLPSAPAFQHMFAGLVSLADWIGSDVRYFPYKAELDCAYMGQARERAAQAIRHLGLETAPVRKAQMGSAFSNISPLGEPRRAQRMIGDWPLDDQLVILEAETGSGKTEAALWRFAKLFEAGLVDGLYFAVPTRAAAKQLHGRVNASLKRLFGAEAPEAVLAVPGYLKAGDFEGKALPSFQVLWDDNPGAKILARRWAAENPKRFLAATVAVGTVDQVMLSALQVKHAHLRGAALARSLLVIDEVHASDAYMAHVQGNLLDTHLARGGHALLMSATLGSSARTRWFRSKDQPNLDEAVETPYPAVSGQTGLRGVQQEGRTKAVQMKLLSDWSSDEAARRALAAARNGARVLVIRNTVRAAVETYDAVAEMGGSELLFKVVGQPALHHSRFASEDRNLLDTAVETVLSPDAHKRSQDGVIVIGTQTLEQSLDICADILITDLCPADVLLQRIGRLHRHDVTRPAGYEKPQCVVMAPAAGLNPFTGEGVFENGLGSFKGGGGVYENLHASELTRRLVGKHAEWVIPDMNRLLVEGATHKEAIDGLNAELGPAWQDFWNRYRGGTLADIQSGARVVLDTSQRFFAEDGQMHLFPDTEEKIRTRLGAEGVRIFFDDGTTGPFGQPISAITCPGHWKGVPVSQEPVAVVHDPDGTLRFTVEGEDGAKVAFAYGFRGLQRKTAP